MGAVRTSAEYEAAATETMLAADGQYRIDTQENLILAAQVWATLALIPDPKPVDRGELGPL